MVGDLDTVHWLKCTSNYSVNDLEKQAKAININIKKTWILSTIRALR